MTADPMAIYAMAKGERLVELPEARSRKCSWTGCDELGDRWITPKVIEGLPDAEPVLMCRRHADMAEAAFADDPPGATPRLGRRLRLDRRRDRPRQPGMVRDQALRLRDGRRHRQPRHQVATVEEVRAILGEAVGTVTVTTNERDTWRPPRGRRESRIL
jgi:hypothetical protein